MSETTPTVHQDVTLRVTNAAGAPPTGAQWEFGDGQQASGVTVNHAWATARTFQVSVTVTLPGGRQANTSASVQVGAMPAPAQVSPPDGTVFNEHPPEVTVVWRAATSHTFPCLCDAAPKRWRITAFAADNSTSAPSAWWQFSHDNRIHPPKPVPVGPANGTQFSNVPRITTLSWEPMTNTEFLNLEVQCFDRDVAGQWANCCTAGVGNSGDVPNDHTFESVGAFKARWRIRGVSPTITSGPWSDWMHFEYTA